jgi:hypothetical protein
VSKILEQRLKQVEFARNLWHVTPESGTTFEDILRPSYWSHVQRTLQKGDRIEIVPADQSYFAELFVLSTAGEVQVAVLRKVVIGTAESSPAASGDEYEIKHRGGAGWSVLRKADKTIMVEKLDTRSGAEEWLQKHTSHALA